MLSLPLYLSTALPLYLSASLPLCLSASLPLCLSASLPLCLSASLPLYLSASLPLYLSASLPLCLSTSLPLCLSRCTCTHSPHSAGRGGQCTPIRGRSPGGHAPDWGHSYRLLCTLHFDLCTTSFAALQTLLRHSLVYLHYQNRHSCKQCSLNSWSQPTVSVVLGRRPFSSSNQQILVLTPKQR